MNNDLKSIVFSIFNTKCKYSDYTFISICKLHSGKYCMFDECPFKVELENIISSFNTLFKKIEGKNIL